MNIYIYIYSYTIDILCETSMDIISMLPRDKIGITAMVTDYFSEKATGTDTYFESIFKVVVVVYF